MIDVRAQVEDFRTAFLAAGSPQRAPDEKAYLKSDLDFFGTDLPTTRASARAFKRAHPELTHDELLSLVAALWGTTSHELRSIGIALLELYPDRLSPADMAFLEGLLRRSRTWAYVDWVATKVVGRFIADLLC